MLRLPLVVDLIHHELGVALDHHTPRAVVERQAQAEYQRVPLSGVVGSLLETPDGLGPRSRRSTRQCRQPLPGRDSARRRRSGWSPTPSPREDLSPMIGDGPINALSMRSARAYVQPNRWRIEKTLRPAECWYPVGTPCLCSNYTGTATQIGLHAGFSGSAGTSTRTTARRIMSPLL